VARFGAVVQPLCPSHREFGGGIVTDFSQLVGRVESHRLIFGSRDRVDVHERADRRRELIVVVSLNEYAAVADA
jgi:hypothetical protein